SELGGTASAHEGRNEVRTITGSSNSLVRHCACRILQPASISNRGQLLRSAASCPERRVHRERFALLMPLMRMTWRRPTSSADRTAGTMVCTACFAAPDGCRCVRAAPFAIGAGEWRDTICLDSGFAAGPSSARRSAVAAIPAPACARGFQRRTARSKRGYVKRERVVLVVGGVHLWRFLAVARHPGAERTDATWRSPADLRDHVRTRISASSRA